MSTRLTVLDFGQNEQALAVHLYGRLRLRISLPDLSAERPDSLAASVVRASGSGGGVFCSVLLRSAGE